jgi:sugar phosphate isomerase/epimerase
LSSPSTKDGSEASNHAKSSDGSDKWFDAVECQKCEARKAHYETASVAIQQLQENIDRLAELVAKLGEHCKEHGDMDGPVDPED